MGVSFDNSWWLILKKVLGLVAVGQGGHGVILLTLRSFDKGSSREWC